LFLIENKFLVQCQIARPATGFRGQLSNMDLG